MAKEGKKLELYEILAAKRAKGKIPPGFEAKAVKQANSLEEQDADGDPGQTETVHLPGVIIDDALNNEFELRRQAASAGSAAAPASREPQTRVREREREREYVPEPQAEPPRPRSPREVVFALDTAFIFFTVVLALVGSSYFLGYKRGQEERPTGLAGIGDIETADPAGIGLRNLSPAPRATITPPEQDFTLMLRTEPASEELPERLELELAEAVARGRQATGRDVQGFIFLTSGNDPRYVLAVGLGRSTNDPELNELQRVYYQMDGLTLSREATPYRASRVASIKELGRLVY